MAALFRFCVFAVLLVLALAQDDVVSLSQQMMAIESISGNEKPMADFLYTWLVQHNYTVERQVIEAGARENLFAYYGKQRVTKLLINGHLDTVPPYIPPTQDDKMLYGRGSTDAKSSIAAQLLAVEALRASGRVSAEDLSFLFVVGEEVDHRGMIAGNDLGLSPLYLLVGEPTESRLAVGHKGAYSFVLQSTGKAAHSGYPELGQSAILPLLDVLQQLARAVFPSDPLLGPTTLNIGLISGGVAGNVVPDYAEATVVVRVSTSVEVVRSIVQGIVLDRVKLVETSANEPVVCATLPGFETSVMAYNTDIPYLQGSPKAYLMGPGSITVAHRPDEAIQKNELIAHVSRYQDLIVAILNQ